MAEYKTIRNPWWRLPVVLALCGLLTGGCARPPFGTAGMENHPLKEAEAAFLQNDYKRSGRLFREVFDQGLNPDMRNAAHYGLACAKLMTAEGESAVDEALEALGAWAPLNRDAARIENPELLVRALGKVTGEARVQSRQNALKMKRMIRSHRKDMEKHKKARKELQGKVARLEAAMETLLHQISELETIDQDLQEKRNPL